MDASIRSDQFTILRRSDNVGKTDLCGNGRFAGIGAATARHIKDQGGRVIGLDRSEPQSDMALAEFHRVDLGNPDSIDAFARKIKARIDGIANVAGASSASPIDVQFDVNFPGVGIFSSNYMTDCRSALPS